MSKGAAIGIILAVFCGGFLGVGLTYLIPASGQIKQTQFTTSNTIAAINDGITTPTAVLDTSLTITTSGFSYLVIRFDTMYVHFLNTAHDGVSRYEINLTLNGVPVRSALIDWVVESALTTWIEISGSLTLIYVTDTLPAGTYTISLTWVSEYSIGSTDSQLIFTAPVFNYSRSILVQEIQI